jgi:hypothetical protein
MAIERKESERIVVLGGTEEDVRRFVESDFKIRSGICPNGHGLLKQTDFGQQCSTCGFFCNTRPDKDTPQ